jgi:hypothetical protein
VFYIALEIVFEVLYVYCVLFWGSMNRTVRLRVQKSQISMSFILVNFKLTCVLYRVRGRFRGNIHLPSLIRGLREP